ncbi:Murein L,D-transpeptidase YafK [Faunimonas pinastri]|uniref:Murein L,D-transpeptidase YafK n=1 Tax=Faunimonas pinastri TaxID=1855383 RepID=A0A1H9HRM3_9HYPH|nr:Murein L,D-transpeptidase YafK [Faunimonas pinastri]
MIEFLPAGLRNAMRQMRDIGQVVVQACRRAHVRQLASVLGGLVVVASLTGCAGQLGGIRAGRVYPATLRLMQAADMDRYAPILVRIYKEESTLEVWKQDHSGHFQLLKAYPICRFSGALGPKQAEGDHQAPEGFYQVGPAQMNPRSREYLSFNIGYPNAFDASFGRTGSALMVHGGCRSVGCYAMTDEQMREIYALAFEAFKGGQRSFQVQALPFRMTWANLRQHAGDPNVDFWTMLKNGTDEFAKTGLPPQVGVCNQRYVFTPAAALGGADPATLCARPASFPPADLPPASLAPPGVSRPLAYDEQPDPLAAQIQSAEGSYDAGLSR